MYILYIYIYIYTYTYIYIYIYIFFFYHTTCESTCNTLPSSAANQADNTVLVAQGCTATSGTTKQLLPLDRVFKRNIYIYIYMPNQLKAEITLDVRSSSFQRHLWFKNAFTLGRWCHSNHFLMLRNHKGMVVPHVFQEFQHEWNTGGTTIPIEIPSISVIYSVRFPSVLSFFMRYCTKAFQTDVIYNSAEWCYLWINWVLKLGGEQKESSWTGLFLFHIAPISLGNV